MPRKPKQSDVRCYHCGSMETSKAGLAHNDRQQRYYCRACRRKFRLNPRRGDGSTMRRLLRRRRNLPSAGHLILELRAIAQNVLKRTPTSTDIKALALEKRAYDIQDYVAVFGSFSEALRRARLTPKYPLQLDPQAMIKELVELRKRLKRPVMVSDVVMAGKKGKISCVYRYQKAFGSVGKAIEEAGAGQRKYGRAEMIILLSRLDAELSRTLTAADINKLHREGKGPSARKIKEEFGSLDAARRVTGARARFSPKYSPEELIELLHDMAKKLGRRPTARDIDRGSKEDSRASVRSFIRVFGNLVAAYRAAGFTDVRPRSYTDREIIDALKRLTKELDRFPVAREIDNASKVYKCPSAATITKRLGRLSEIRSRF